MKRLIYSSMVGIVTRQEDDDGEIAMEEVRDKHYRGLQTTNHYNPRNNAPEVIDKEQLGQIEYELAEFPEQERAEKVQEIYEAYNIRSLADIPKNKYDVSLKQLRRIKLVRKGLA